MSERVKDARGPEGAQGARRAPLPWALGPEALRASEPEKNKERHYGVALRLSSTQRARRLCRNAVENGL